MQTLSASSASLHQRRRSPAPRQTILTRKAVQDRMALLQQRSLWYACACFLASQAADALG